MQYYLMAFKKYATFSGRSRRAEYWFFVLFNILAAIVAMVLDSVLGLASDEMPGVIYPLYTLAVILPSIALLVRRLHDTGRSGWWFFIGLIPLVGGIILLVFMCSDSQAGDNQYGPNPKGA